MLQPRTTKKSIKAMRQVQAAAEVAMAEVIDYVKHKHHPTKEVAHQIIDDILAKHNYTSPEGHVVASGPESAEPHANGAGMIIDGEPIVIDIFPQSIETGYFADITRTVSKGTPSAELQRMYDVVVVAQELATELVRPGVKGAAIHEAVVDFFKENGFVTSGAGSEFPYGEGFVHSLGHGVGKTLHEVPRLGERSTDVLEVGDVITIEPGLYYQDVGGVRMEDMLLVTETGYEHLTHFPKTLRL